MEIDLDRVTLRSDVAPPHPPFAVAIAFRIPASEGSTQRPQQIGDPFRLRLGQRHDRAERLDEPDEVEARVRGNDPAVEGNPVLGRRDEVRVEERKGDLVTRAVDDEVDLLLAAVREPDRTAAGEARCSA